MSLRIVLQAIGTVVVGGMLLLAFLSMGPVGWVVIGAMFVIGVLQVHRNRRRGDRNSGDMPAYCANCGAALPVDAFDSDDLEDSEYETDYCSRCGAPVVPEPQDSSASTQRNCPDCGALNEPGADECNYCHADL